MLPDAIQKEICRRFHVKVVYLFGSFATGRQDGRSDLDLGVYFDQVMDRFELFARAALFQQALTSEENFPHPVEVLILNEATPLVTYEVIKGGKVLFSEDEEWRVAFEVQSIKAYFDDLIFDAIYFEAFKRRLREGGEVSSQIIQDRLLEMDENLALLEEMKGMPLKEFLADPKVYKLAERCLQLSIECLLDICDHIIASENWPKPLDRAGAIIRLAEKGVYPRDYAEKIVGMANFRNILVHAYLRIDRALVYEHMQKIQDFRDFQRYILDYLERPTVR